MKALFCYDGTLLKNNNEYYSPVMTNQMFSRYFMAADHLTLAVRTRDMSESERDKKIDRLELNNIDVIECPNLSSAKGSIINHKKAKEMLTRAISESELLFIRVPSLLGSMAIDIANKMNKPFLAEVVGCPWDGYWNHSIKGKFMAVPYTLKMKKQIKSAKYVVYVTNSFLQSRYPTNGMQAACSNVELNELDNNVILKRLAKIEKNDGRLIIGTAAGVNVRYKGQQYIIEALGSLKKTGITNFEYQLAGAGDQSYLRNVAKSFGVESQVKFLGNLSRDGVYQWLDFIDIYAQPSRQEGLPRALIEAMSRGLICLGAKTGGIPELLDEKYIFSNTKNNITEIIEILSAIDAEAMADQAVRNYNEAKNYDRKDIMKRRKKIFTAYAEEVKQS